jgi:fermentation-respiration switch protein FrsA (DUF1100 family)
VLKVLLIAVIVYTVIATAMYVFQRSFIYHPDPHRVAPEAVGLPEASERVLKTADGEQLVTWYAKAKPEMPTILYFHGNAGNLSDRRDRMRNFIDHGLGVLMMAYRGYSGSTGDPTEANNITDAKSAYDVLLGDGLNPGDIFIYGESLGAAVAVALAAKRQVRAVILDSPFTSLVKRARLSYPWLPVGLLLKDRYMSDIIVKSVHVPLLVVHGEADEVTPVSMGRALFANANPPKELITLPGAGHSNHDAFGAPAMINAWIDRVWHGAAN